MFFSALAKPLEDRHAKYKDKFKHIPYLNSSLFEHSDIEKKTFDITALKDEEMEVYPSTVLKDTTGKRLKGKLGTLEYIFKFLDAYDFSADANTLVEEGGHETKTLINASVLGLIFEKINGYKDGSFYTPGTITMFMCKETIRKAVVDRFKSEYHQDINSFEDVKDYCAQFFKKEDILKFNETINKLKICDPAVGSGHFLVSALNEVIAIKSELGILSTEEGKRIPCEVTIENDELYISYSEGELFEYQRQDTNSLLIQKTLFHEKQIVIENCLFGVDINPNSVNICRLRLWIELLKNAYYTSEGELQTLPNIDINIKCGNSLISRFSLNDSLKDAFKNKEVSYKISDYKTAVDEYKQTNSKEKKREVLDIISTIKSNFKSTLDSKSKEKVSKAIGEYENEKQRLDNIVLFGEKLKKAEKDNLKKLKVKADKLQQEKDEILNNIIYKDAFEWRFEFPEVLDSKGEYVGFDVIIGNPPYIQLQKMGKASDVLQQLGYYTFARTGDIYSLFYELGNNILKEKGLLTYITSNKWMRAAYGESLRQYFIDYTDTLMLIDFGGVQIFDSATVDTNILMFAKDKNRQQTKACTVKEKVLNNLSLYFEQSYNISAFNSPTSWIVLSEIEQRIKDKIEAIGTPLKEWDISINYGIKTGYNEAFIIDNEKREELIKQDPKSAEIIRPILRGRDIKKYSYIPSNLYIITTFPSLNINIEDYPKIKQHLLSFGQKRLEQSGMKGSRKKTNNKWFETQDTINYWNKFYENKIVWNRISSTKHFCLVNSGIFIQDSMHFFTGNHLEYLNVILNSKLFVWLMTIIVGEAAGGNSGNSDNIKELKIKIPNSEEENEVLNLFNLGEIKEVDKILFKKYNLTSEEILVIKTS
ncbi:Eco57I restriction-modification methylase domain-containing protein [Myroides marinus]|uniref:Eco57I restriction-modification methylase domain-containing protein n=1 Tax=Myroides marinus TaxID=703342 RepID=UPI002577942C|nr:Eco57I restriction-modification methylase domain-containing protein [Myroides marinus]MDM1404738.1 Eco57I restriction-modification methylase domain-containing protein [Myroides marinus]